MSLSCTTGAPDFLHRELRSSPCAWYTWHHHGPTIAAVLAGRWSASVCSGFLWSPVKSSVGSMGIPDSVLGGGPCLSVFSPCSSVVRDVKFCVNPQHTFFFWLSQLLMHFHAKMSLDNNCYKILMTCFQHNWILSIYFSTLGHSPVNATKAGIQFECQRVWCCCDWSNCRRKDTLCREYILRKTQRLLTPLPE